MEFDELYRRHFDDVWRIVARLTHPGNPDVEDLVQDVFCVAYRKLAQYDGRCKPTTWLYGICRWRVANYRSRSRVSAKPAPPAAAASVVSQARDPEEQCSSVEMSRLVYRVLDGLGATRREVLILYEIEGLSGPVIAELTGCKEATVWTRLHKARKDFSKRLARILGTTAADQLTALAAAKEA